MYQFLIFIVQLAWVIYVDLLCLDYDGNVLDACVIAMLAALRSGTFILALCICYRYLLRFRQFINNFYS